MESGIRETPDLVALTPCTCKERRAKEELGEIREREDAIPEQPQVEQGFLLKSECPTQEHRSADEQAQDERATPGMGVPVELLP